MPLPPIDKAEIRKLRDLVAHFDQRRDRARTRLNFLPGAHACLGIVGLQCETETYAFEPVAVLRAVVEPPGEIELAKALLDKSRMSAIARHSKSISFELAMRPLDGRAWQDDVGLAWTIMSALRLRARVECIVPAVANYSWSTIAGVPDDSCEVLLLEDMPRAHRLAKPSTVTRADLDWVHSHLLGFAELLRAAQFKLAIDCLTTHHQNESLRMVAASLWTGFEALLGAESEITFQVAARAAAFLEPRGSGRLDLHRSVKKLYGLRSKVVHGSAVSDDALKEHVLSVRELLSRLLVAMTERGAVPTRDDFEALLFT